MLRLPFEHAAAYASDCARHAYAALIAVDRDVAAGSPPVVRDQLQALAVRVDRVVQDLYEIRNSLVSLRHSPAVMERLSPSAEDDLRALDSLAMAMSGLVPRAAVFLRLDELRGSVPDRLTHSSASRAAAFAGVRDVRDAAERASSEPTGEAVSDAVAAIESLHDGTSFDEAIATERKRWE
jgi:hypothetical protein